MSSAQQPQPNRPSLPEDTRLAPTLAFLEGQWTKGAASIPVLDKYTGEVFAEVSEPSAAQVAHAVAAARKAVNAGPPPPMPVPQR